MEAEERRPSVQVAARLAEIFELPQEERKSFLRFARGDWQANPDEQTKDVPWHFSQTSGSNLPIYLTSFIGREKEIDEIKVLLLKNRLVTLVGAGGIGKTRLSLKVGGNLLHDYPNGVWFVALDSLSDPALVPHEVASAFDIREGSSDQPILNRLLYFLRSKTTLLVLDNCEHLLYGCAQLVQRLLTDCPGLQILATSREVLNLDGEAAYVLTSLSIPERDISLETLIGYESIRLFVERASLAHSSFRLTDENARAILEISRRVDGIPLAIELAAAHTNILQAKEILQQLDQSFSLLASDGLMRMERHRTLQASLDWSWGLLSESEQRLLRQLSVFAGGWTLESARVVCDGDIFTLTGSLTKKSLIVVDQEPGRETRYHFHEIVRQYAHEKLVESGEEETVRTRHLQYFLNLSKHAETALKGPTQSEWISRLSNERDNIRTALEKAEAADAEAGLYLSGRLHRFWERFDLREGARWLAKFLEKEESKSYPLARAKALCTQTWLMVWVQEFYLARLAAQECLDLYKACGDIFGEIDGLLAMSLPDPTTSQDIELLQQALNLSKSLGDQWREAQVMVQLSWSSNDYRESISFMEEAVILFKKVGDLELATQHMISLGNYEIRNDNVRLAQKWLDEAKKINQNLDSAGLKSEIIGLSGTIALIKGDYEAARAQLGKAAAIAESLGHQWSLLWIRARLGYVALHEGNLIEAHNIFADIAKMFQKIQFEIGVAYVLEGIASLSVVLDKPAVATQIIGWADATRERIKDTRPRLEQEDVDKIIAACIAAMGETAFSDEYDKGQKMTMEQAVAYALEEHS
jgi:predicted ATPase